MTRRGLTIVVLALVVAALCRVPRGAAEEPDGRCSVDAEQQTSACTAGDRCVWSFPITTPAGETHDSWCYKSRDRAERARDSDRDLCETVSRYWDKQPCPTRYGDPYCNACAGPDKTCADDARQRVDRLVLNVYERNRQLGLRKVWLDAATTLTRAKLGVGRMRGVTTASYASSLQDGLSRAARLKAELGAVCDQQLADMDAQLERLRNELDALESSAPDLDLRDVETLDLSAYVDIEVSEVERPTGASGIVLDGHPRLSRGTKLKSEVRQVGLAGADAHGALRIARATISKAQDADGRDVITISGTIDGANHKVVLIGSPDQDRDGLADRSDRCPQAAGRKEHGGCPDSDGDSVPDDRDACPQAPGSSASKGCPPDSDGDGVPDAQDRCPNQPGQPGSQGCQAAPAAQGSGSSAVCASMLSQVGPFGCPSQPPNVPVGQCMRDTYVAAAVMQCWAAACYTRSGETAKAVSHEQAAQQELAKARGLCSSATAVGGMDCSTLHIAPCP